LEVALFLFENDKILFDIFHIKLYTKMKTARGILKILLLYLVIFGSFGLFYHLVIQGNKIENSTGFIEVVFHPDIFYLYFLIAGFEVLRFLYQKESKR
jgi:hypothetical protein